jgi:acetyl-CoA carboxylase carboxyl transferase subunit beta
MNWLTNYVRPKVRAVLRDRKDTPDNLWYKCPQCGQMIFHKEFAANQKVCSHCQYHERIGALERFDALFDKGSYRQMSLPAVPDDPLKFKDSKKYTDRLSESRSRTGAHDAVSVACGKLGGFQVVIAVQDFSFLGGSMGVAAGEALLAAARKAVKENKPLIVFTAAGGARMQEGILSLMQMPRTTVAVEMLLEAGVPYIVVLTDPTTGGVTASFAMLGDVTLAEPGALIAFTGPRVIESTIREKLPEGFQRAEYLYDHGMVDLVVHRHTLREALIRIIGLLLDKLPDSGEVLLLSHQRLEEMTPKVASRKAAAQANP